MKTIPHSFPTIENDDILDVAQAMEEKSIAQGKYVRQLELAISEYLGYSDCTATSSGTSALHLALLSLDVKRGDEVILPSFVCVSLLQAISYVKAKPVLVDIDEQTLNINIQDIYNKITPQTKAVIIPHQFGLPAAIDKIDANGLFIIEDCAQSIGAQINGVPVGSFGHVSIFSFYATKMIASGEGGLISTVLPPIAYQIKDLREYDEKEDFKIRYNYKMSDIEAALALNQFRKLHQFIKIRQNIAEKYSEAWHDLPVTLPVRASNHIYFRYIIQVSNNAERIVNLLNEKGISARKPIYKPLHFYLGQSGFINTEHAYKHSISIPIYPSLSGEQIEYIIDSVFSIVKKNI